ncbi:aminomethyl transferase family protein [Streptomyces sp. NPDC052207]|uniref:aminomethyl transferase family protein n=1 Tax=Streptomyces sp. NPDC052207 TaxID=3155418 RepID=UPI0034411FD8
MSGENLEAKIERSGTPLRMLRNAPAGAYPFPMRPEFTNWRDEQEAWKKTAVLFDQSFHMTDVSFKGPDVGRLLADLGTNSFRTFGKNKAKQFVACDDEGRLVGDAILFGLEDDKASLVGSPTVPDWVAFHAETGNYDVEVIRDERTLANQGQRSLYRYQLQGPAALQIAEKAHGTRIEHIKFFNIGEFTIASRPVRALNHTMTGIPGQEMTGLELFGPAEDGTAVLEALLQAGSEFGLLQGGAVAYSTTALESGWLGLPVPAIYSGESTKAFREWLAADNYLGNASLAGSFTPDRIEDYYVTPFDLGYRGIVKFDHDFVGRPALEERLDQPHRRKVWLRWNNEDVTRVIAGSLFDGDQRTKYLDIPYGVYATFQYDAVLDGDHVIGFSNRTGYTANVGGWSSLAVIDQAHAQDGTEVTILWGESGGTRPGIERHVQTTIRATVSTRPLA